MARLRRGGSGITFQKTSPARVAGYGGIQFDGDVWGIFGHSFVPFTPTTHGASPWDSWHIDKGEAFRFIVLAVKGKTVVLFEESFGLPADQFPAFLTDVNRVLASLSFTGWTGLGSIAPRSSKPMHERDRRVGPRGSDCSATCETGLDSTAEW